MDNAGMSLFKGAEINLSNKTQNDEDEEDLEEQRRRKEELQTLVMAKLDNFNFDESTVNSSSNISVMSNDELQNKYCEATNPNEQMKVLYDVRLREINNLREEYENFKKNKSNEIDYLKNKMFMYEAEIQQMKISLKNSEELLIEKTGCISELKNSLNKQNELIEEYDMTIQNFQIDVNTYQSTISELQLKLEAEKNPFQLGAKRFHSEELQRAHQEHIARLEALLEEKNKTSTIMEKERLSLQKQIEKLIDIENEDKTVIKVLTKNFESAQKQCQELIGIIEKLTNENHHLKDRVNEKYVDSTFENTSNHNNSTAIEKLKKMLLDKSIENEALEAKLRDYGNNIKELLEYRQIKLDVYKKEFQQCENKDHTKSLLLMQNDLQNYKRIIEDKNQQILSLNSTNKELLEKLEDMLSQTRNDIQNFSHKYNLPQLEKMTEDLRKSQEKIAELEKELKQSEERRASLCTKLQKAKSPNKELEIRFNDLQHKIERERNSFENQLKKLHKDVEVAAKEISSLKSFIDQLIDENTRLKLDIKSSECENEMKLEKSIGNKHSEEYLKMQYLEAVQRTQEAQNRIKHLEETIQDLTNGKTLAEGEQYTLRYQINDCRNKLQEQNENIKDLENDIKNQTKTLKEKDDLIDELRLNPSLKDFEELEKSLKLMEKTKKELFQQMGNLKYELEKSREEIMRLTKELAIETERTVRRNLEKELDETQHALEEHRERSDESESNVLRIELKIREEIQNEYLQKLKEIEKRYEKSCVFNKELFKEQAKKLKIQENKYREQLGIILTECAQKIKALEHDRENLLRQNNCIQDSFENYKQHTAASEEAYKRIFKESQRELQKQTDQWKKWSKKFVCNCIEIENMHKDNKEKMFHKIDSFDKEVQAVEKTYNDKIKKYVKKL